MTRPPETETPSKPVEKANSVAEHLQQHDNHALTELHQDLQGMKAQDRQQFFHTLAGDAQSAKGLPGLEITNKNNQLRVAEAGGAVLYDEGGADRVGANRTQPPEGRTSTTPPEKQTPGDSQGQAPTDRQAAPAQGAQPEQEMTPKLRAGEGPYQALHRQHPDWNNQKLKEESHKILEQTGRNSFKQGEQFKFNSDGSVTSHLDNRSKDGSYTETTSKDGKPVGDKVHMTTPDGYTEVEQNANGKKQTTHTDDGNGGYKEHSESTDGTVSDTTYDPTTKITHSESVDANKNTTVRDTNGDGTYSETTTDNATKKTHTESVDKDKNKTVTDADPATGSYQTQVTDAKGRETHSESRDQNGATTSKDTNPDTGAFTEKSRDSSGKVSDVTHTPTQDGYTETAHRDGKTIQTTHKDTGDGNYEEHSESSDGSSSLTKYDKASGIAHTETMDSNGNKTVRDQSDDGSSKQVTTDIHNRQIESQTVDTKKNKTVRETNPDTGTYTETTTNADGKETRSESLDKNHHKTVKETNPDTGAYKTTVTDSKDRETRSETGDSDHKTVRTTNPENGSYHEVTTDAKGKTTDEITHSKLPRGFYDVEKSGDKTTRTMHVDDSKGGYRETKTDSDGNSSQAVFDKTTGKTHTDSYDRDLNHTVRDENVDGTYTQTTKDIRGRETGSESVDSHHNKTVKQINPDTGAFKQTTTDASGRPIAGSNQEANGDTGSWQINSDGTTTYMTEHNGQKAENTFTDGHLTKSVDTDTKSGVVKTSIHQDGKVTTTTHTPGGAQDTVETKPEVVAAA
jgi:hypothetical protein